MKEAIFGFLLGSSLGIGLLLCPQARHFVDKMSAKIQHKIELLKEDNEETSE